ncbi:hypothetical protein BGZ76_003346 [Entomortierella beljakovae]|nr:hypothetical protein BGZ76_003346 [Entomortierella beljakovae]
MSTVPSNAEQGVSTLRAHFEQAQGPNADAHQILQHLQNNFNSMDEANQQFADMQNTIHNTMPQQAQIPMPFTNKYKGDDDELIFPEFKAKLQTMFARFPDALKTDHDQIQFWLVNAFSMLPD